MVRRLSFDAHGKRRLADWTAGDPAAPDAETPRGFTGHEHLDSIGLIHMNGRVYDPTLGRFLSVDPFVPNPTATQSFNRYSYVINNPLSYTDPTGFRGEMDGYGGDSGGRDGGFASPDFGSGSSGSSSPSASPGDDNIGADSDRSFLDRLQDFLDSPFGKSVGGIVGGFATGAGMAATGGAVALGVGSAIAEAVDYDVPNTQQHSQYGDEYGGPTRDGAHGIQVASFDRFSSVGFDGPVSQLPLLSRPDVQERLSSLGIVALGIASADTPAPGPADVAGGIVFGVGAAIILMQAALTSDQANTQSTTNEESEDLYGPFYRAESPTQTVDTAKLQVASGEIWGRAPRGGAFPAVQAYVGPLPDGERGIEFYTETKPDGWPGSAMAGHVYWRGPREGVRVEDDFAKIRVNITKNTQF